MVEESLSDWSREAEPHIKPRRASVGTARMALERVEERVDLTIACSELMTPCRKRKTGSGQGRN